MGNTTFSLIITNSYTNKYILLQKFAFHFQIKIAPLMYLGGLDRAKSCVIFVITSGENQMELA
jgi:hypothetical protein